MRIVQVLGTSGGGVVRHVADLWAGLVSAGDDVSVVAPESSLDTLGRLAAAESLAPPSTRVLDITARPRLQDLVVLGRLRRLIGGADVVHAHGVRAGALAGLALASVPGLRRPRLVVTVHNGPPEGRGQALVFRMLEWVVARCADDVMVVSADLGARMLRARARTVQRALVPAPAPRTAAGAADRWSPTDGRALVATAARLAPQKALHLLLDAVAEIVAGRPDALRVVVAGEGPLLGDLRADAARRRLPVDFPGRVDDVPALFAAADVVVSTSRWEGQPLVLQEALRAGAAIVATDVGGVREVCGDAAVLVPWTPAHGTRGPVEEFAAALRDVVDDRELRRRLEGAAHSAAQSLPNRAQAVAQVRGVYAREAAGRSRD